jgi:hypothetical protein
MEKRISERNTREIEIFSRLLKAKKMLSFIFEIVMGRIFLVIL